MRRAKADCSTVILCADAASIVLNYRWCSIALYLGELAAEFILRGFMYTSDYTVVVNKPIDFVFANVTCLKGCINWVAGMRSAKKIGDEPVHVGSQYRHVVTIMGL